MTRLHLLRVFSTRHVVLKITHLIRKERLGESNVISLIRTNYPDEEGDYPRLIMFWTEMDGNAGREQEYLVLQFSTNPLLCRELVQRSHMFQWGGWTLASRGHRCSERGAAEPGDKRWWSCEGCTDEDSQRQNEPLAAWHDRPLDLLPHRYWQSCVTHTQITNNNLSAVWEWFDPGGEVL